MAVLIFLSLLVHTTTSTIVVTPPTDQTIAINSLESVTFSCNVTGDGSLVREAVWQAQGFQIQNDDNNVRTSFANVGIFVSPISVGVTEIIINSTARDLYRIQSSSSPDVVVRCTSFIPGPPPSSELGEFLSVITFEAPSLPTDVSLTPNPNDLTQLIFMWGPPSNLLAGVDVFYHPSITGLSFNISNTTTDTYVIFRGDASPNCQTHTFSVFASNTAGDGPSVSLLETIPISPDITALNEGYQVTQVSLAGTISLILSIPLAQTCSPSFPIQNYSYSIPSVISRQELDFTSGEEDSPLVREVQIPGLQLNGIFEIFVETCISITCRQSRSLVFRTTDLQTANITFFENNIFMRCKFAMNSNALGCTFQLTVTNGTEYFFLPRSGSSISQCNQTLNQADAYVPPLIASDHEAIGVIGTEPITVQPVIIEEAQSYTSQTGCTIPVPESGLSSGAIAAIVVAVIVAGLVVVGVVVIVVGVVYRVRTGHWFKIRERNDDKIIVHFEKELLMGDIKPIKRKKSKTRVSNSGTDSPDGEANIALKSSPQPLYKNSNNEDGSEIAGLGVQVRPIKMGAVEPDASAATNPDAAFTLDISSDRKKVELHLNRALIKRVLQERNINTMNRKKIKRQPSIRKQRLLPLSLPCELRVGVDDNEADQL